MITAPSPFPDVEAMEPERAAVRELAAHKDLSGLSAGHGGRLRGAG